MSLLSLQLVTATNVGRYVDTVCHLTVHGWRKSISQSQHDDAFHPSPFTLSRTSMFDPVVRCSIRQQNCDESVALISYLSFNSMRFVSAMTTWRSWRHHHRGRRQRRQRRYFLSCVEHVCAIFLATFWTVEPLKKNEVTEIRCCSLLFMCWGWADGRSPKEKHSTTYNSNSLRPFRLWLSRDCNGFCLCFCVARKCWSVERFPCLCRLPAYGLQNHEAFYSRNNLHSLSRLDSWWPT